MNIVSNKPTITRKEMEGVLDYLMNGDLAGSSLVKQFENNVCALINQRHALAVNSSTSAYHLAYKSLDLRANDEVIIPSFFDLAPLSALTLTGASPVIVDAEDSSFVPSLAQIKEKITPRTKAIVTGHLFGFPINIEDLLQLNIPVIEDISHIIGYNFENTPASGTIRIASFSPGSIITTGNGGIALTNNSRLFAAMRDHREAQPDNLNISYDYTMNGFQAAIGINQLSRLRDFIKRRKEIAKLYYESIKFTSHKTMYHYNEEFVFHSFPVLFDSPSEKTETYWKKNKIEVKRPVTTPLHRYLKLKPMDYPNSERLSNKLFSLPIYPSLTKKEIEKILKANSKFI